MARLRFKVMSGEYKVMGLAPYGQPSYVEQIRELTNSFEDNQFKLNMEYFDFSNLKRMYSDKLQELFEIEPRQPESAITQTHKDIAKSLQLVLEENILKQAIYLKEMTKSKNLCLSGGVSLNCVAVGKIKEAGIFDDVYVPPAPGDSGSAIGCALLSYYKHNPKRVDLGETFSPYLGPSYSNDDIISTLDRLNVSYTDHSTKPQVLFDTIAKLIDGGAIIGLFNGRMECGPRALGSRSIIADPRCPDMRNKLNAVIKKRENFRPFAPAILAEHIDDYLEGSASSFYMSTTCQVKPDLNLPAVTHVDNSCRPQTVDKNLSPYFHAVIQSFYELTGCATVVNTSFNVRGEPVVCTPIDALRCFAVSNLDYLVLEHCIIDRKVLSQTFVELATHDFEYIKPPRDLFTRKDISSVYSFI
ncbi:carbamoyltransferase family protein [Photobacterium damselae]